MKTKMFEAFEMLTVFAVSLATCALLIVALAGAFQPAVEDGVPLLAQRAQTVADASQPTSSFHEGAPSPLGTAAAKQNER